MTSKCIKNWKIGKNNRPQTLWSPAAAPFLKWNIDASVIGKPGPAGIGGILRDHRGNFKAIFSCFIGVKDSNEAKLIAILKALEISEQNNFLNNSHIEMESYSANAITWANGPLDKCPLKLWDLLSKIKALIAMPSSFKLSHIFREANTTVDCLAKSDHLIIEVQLQ